MPEEPRSPLAGSERTAPAHARVGEVDAASTATVSLYLRAGVPPEPAGTALSRTEFAERFGADPADVELLRRFAADHGLEVGAVDLARRRVEITGGLGALAAAFGTALALYRAPDGTTYRARTGPLAVPAALSGVVTGVFGLDERPQARPQFRPHPAVTRQYSPVQVAGAYAFPRTVTGAGECVALIELGGGFRAEDLAAYFAGIGLGAPSVEAVSVDGAANAPGAAGGPDGEVMLDIEVVGAVAPGAHVAVYFAPNTDQGFLDAVTAAVHDTTRRPSVVSISWGGPESTWTTQAMTEMERAFAAAAAMGVTVTVAAGDNGSSDGLNDGRQHVDFPASAPHALACGGTRLELSGDAITSETVWNDGPGQGATGGGVSAVFPLPSYQSAAGVPRAANPGGAPGRGVPDVAGDADPDTGYLVRVDGQTVPIGGTSAVAPLWAGLVALLNEALGRPAGFLQPTLYAAGSAGALHDVVQGSNGAYDAGPGWDPCTGLGSPDGTALLALLRGGA